MNIKKIVLGLLFSICPLTVLPMDDQDFDRQFSQTRLDRRMNKKISKIIWRNNERNPNKANQGQGNPGDIACKAIQGVWFASNPKEYPDLKNKKNVSDWVFLVKERNLRESEASLIFLLAYKFGVKDKISCGRVWQKKPYGNWIEKTYLWIKKDSFKKVVSIFNLKIKDVRFTI